MTLVTLKKTPMIDCRHYDCSDSNKDSNDSIEESKITSIKNIFTLMTLIFNEDSFDFLKQLLTQRNALMALMKTLMNLKNFNEDFFTLETLF